MAEYVEFGKDKKLTFKQTKLKINIIEYLEKGKDTDLIISQLFLVGFILSDSLINKILCIIMNGLWFFTYYMKIKKLNKLKEEVILYGIMKDE